MRYLVRLSVPRAGGWRAWGTTRDEFGHQLAEQESAAIALHVDSEIRRGRDYVRVVIVATVDAADVAEALELTWWALRKAAGEDLAGWDLARAAAEVRPEAPLGRTSPRRGANIVVDQVKQLRPMTTQSCNFRDRKLYHLVKRVDQWAGGEVRIRDCAAAAR